MTSGIEGFRLAVWIAYRGHFWSLTTNASDPTGDGVDSKATSSLVIRCLSPSQVKERLLQHFVTQVPAPLSQEPHRRLYVRYLPSPIPALCLSLPLESTSVRSWCRPSPILQQPSRMYMDCMMDEINVKVLSTKFLKFAASPSPFAPRLQNPFVQPWTARYSMLQTRMLQSCLGGQFGTWLVQCVNGATQLMRSQQV